MHTRGGRQVSVPDSVHLRELLGAGGDEAWEARRVRLEDPALTDTEDGGQLSQGPGCAGSCAGNHADAGNPRYLQAKLAIHLAVASEKLRGK